MSVRGIVSVLRMIVTMSSRSCLWLIGLPPWSRAASMTERKSP